MYAGSLFKRHRIKHITPIFALPCHIHLLTNMLPPITERLESPKGSSIMGAMELEYRFVDWWRLP
jgi:hypothetical protein